jgi:hypothetical protein
VVTDPGLKNPGVFCCIAVDFAAVAGGLSSNTPAVGTLQLSVINRAMPSRLLWCG